MSGQKAFTPASFGFILRKYLTESLFTESHFFCFLLTEIPILLTEIPILLTGIQILLTEISILLTENSSDRLFLKNRFRQRFCLTP
jgi:hypothetical protein